MRVYNNRVRPCLEIAELGSRRYFRVPRIPPLPCEPVRVLSLPEHTLHRAPGVSSVPPCVEVHKHQERNAMNKIIENTYVVISRLTPEQAKSSDKKPRLGIQGTFLVEPAHGKGKNAVPETRHEFSALRADRPINPGKYFLFGKMAVEIEEKPFKTHETNGVRYAKHAASIKFVTGEIIPAESAPF